MLTRDAGPNIYKVNKPHIVGFSRLRREKPARALHRRANINNHVIPDARRALDYLDYGHGVISNKKVVTFILIVHC